MTVSTDSTAESLEATPAAGLPKAVWALLALLAASMVAFVTGAVVNGTGDSVVVINGTHWAAGCVGAGKLSACGGEVGPYPLLQYVPSAIFMRLGMPDETILRWFGLLSAAAFVGILAVVAGTLRRSKSQAVLAAGLLIVVASPLPWYAWSTFGESLGALASLCFVAAAALRLHPAVLGASLVVAGQTKETALPFLAILAVALLLWSTLSDQPARRSHWVALLVGAVASVVVTAGFNEFRFGQFSNMVYADPIAHVPSIDLKLKYAVSIWAAPNAGVLTFWPTFGLLIAAMLLIMIRSRQRSSERWRLLGGGGVVLLVLAGLTAGYASWYAPFGWIAWGPRLMILLIPAVGLAILALFAPELERLLGARRIAARVALGLALTVAVLGALPQVGVLHHPEVIGELFASDAQCPVQAPIGDNPGYYYSCIFHWAWWKGSILADAAAGLIESPVAFAMGAVWVAGIIALAIVARRSALAATDQLKTEPIESKP